MCYILRRLRPSGRAVAQRESTPLQTERSEVQILPVLPGLGGSRAADFRTTRWMWKAGGSHCGVRAANPAIKTTKVAAGGTDLSRLRSERPAHGCMRPRSWQSPVAKPKGARSGQRALSRHREGLKASASQARVGIKLRSARKREYERGVGFSPMALGACRPRPASPRWLPECGCRVSLPRAVGGRCRVLWLPSGTRMVVWAGELRGFVPLEVSGGTLLAENGEYKNHAAVH